MPDRELLLLQNTDGPLLTACPCSAPTILGEYVVALVLEDGGKAGLCTQCARQAGPELAVVVEALNGLAVMSPGLSPEHAVRVICALVEQLARLAGPTVAIMNVHPHIVERLNQQ